jgi:hypothetical protein
MRATSPTTRSVHAFAHFIKADSYTAISVFVFHIIGVDASISTGPAEFI